jgi:pentatricopeptide repeat protein
MVTGQVGQVIPGTAKVTDLGAAQSGEERPNRTVAIVPCSSFIRALSKAKRLVEEACEVWKNECYDSQQRDY